LLARYEMGRLSDEERRRFEAHVLSCDACFAELERSSAVAETMRRDAARLLEALVQRRRRAVLTGPLGWRAVLARLLRWPVLVPAGAVVLLLVGLWISGQRDPRRLAQFPTDPLPTELVRAPAAPEPARELLEAGRAHFNLGHYDEAARRFEAALRWGSEEPATRYLLGVSLALAGRTEEAIPHLEAAASAPDSLGRAARWVLANAHLAEGDIAAARRLLRELARGEGPLAQRARRLLARLP
jgi:tetratricopeptide (TPR) repeat protein